MAKRFGADELSAGTAKDWTKARSYSGVIRRRGGGPSYVWQCGHVHSTAGEALTCSSAELARRRADSIAGPLEAGITDGTVYLDNCPEPQDYANELLDKGVDPEEAISEGDVLACGGCPIGGGLDCPGVWRWHHDHSLVTQADRERVS